MNMRLKIHYPHLCRRIQPFVQLIATNIQQTLWVLQFQLWATTNAHNPLQSAANWITLIRSFIHLFYGLQWNVLFMYSNTFKYSQWANCGIYLRSDKRLVTFVGLCAHIRMEIRSSGIALPDDFVWFAIMSLEQMLKHTRLHYKQKNERSQRLGFSASFPSLSKFLINYYYVHDVCESGRNEPA